MELFMSNKFVFIVLFVCILSSCQIIDSNNPKPSRTMDIASEYARKHQSAIKQKDGSGPKTASSLWVPGSRTFFRDQRARLVGDILKVNIAIKESAEIGNNSSSSSSSTKSMGLPNFLGLESALAAALPSTFTPKAAISASGSSASAGGGKVSRKENITVTIAATVVDILPSNNLFIKGSQEVLVDNEMRVVGIEGIVRPEDITASNSVSLDQIADARVVYGGNGVLTNMQQPSYGVQVLNKTMPF